VVDVKTQFDPSNAAHHAVLAPAYGEGLTAPPSGPLASAVFGTHPYNGQAITWESKLECEDCHYGDPNGNKLNGHGTVNSRYMLRDANGDDALGYYDSQEDRTLVCFGCHDPLTNPTNFARHVGRDGDHMADQNNLYGIACLNCHGGGFPESAFVPGPVPGVVPWGAIHGVSATAPVPDPPPPLDPPHTPKVFTYGAGLGYVQQWTNLGSPSCGATSSTNVLNACVNHSGASQSYTRIHSREYRNP
jgi:hypothetical protein